MVGNVASMLTHGMSGKGFGRQVAQGRVQLGHSVLDVGRHLEGARNPGTDQNGYIHLLACVLGHLPVSRSSFPANSTALGSSEEVGDFSSCNRKGSLLSGLLVLGQAAM